jgi:hypothetical protein
VVAPHQCDGRVIARQHLCPTGPTCRSCPFTRASRFIFVGMIGRRVETSVNQEGGRSAVELASTSGLRSRLRSDPSARTFGRGTDPALGFASCRVDGHVSVHPIGLDPVSDHQPPGIAPFRQRSGDTHPQSAHGFSASFPTVTCSVRPSRESSLVVRPSHPCCAVCYRRESPSLQRVDGADASLFPAFSEPGELPV